MGIRMRFWILQVKIEWMACTELYFFLIFTEMKPDHTVRTQLTVFYSITFVWKNSNNIMVELCRIFCSLVHSQAKWCRLDNSPLGVGY